MTHRFDWDPAKAVANVKKHGIAFNEAITTFDDPDRLILADPWHSTASETRELVIGASDQKRELLVVYTDREPGITRLISARRATRRERKIYCENQEKGHER